MLYQQTGHVEEQARRHTGNHWPKFHYTFIKVFYVVTNTFYTFILIVHFHTTILIFKHSISVNRNVNANVIRNLLTKYRQQGILARKPVFFTVHHFTVEISSIGVQSFRKLSKVPRT